MNRIKQFRLRWEPRDLWCGIFWDIKVQSVPVGNGYPRAMQKHLHIYICILPMLPIHIVIQ